MGALTIRPDKESTGLSLVVSRAINLGFLSLVFLIPLAFYPQLLKAYAHFKSTILIFLGLWVIICAVFHLFHQGVRGRISLFIGLVLIYFFINLSSLLIAVNKYEAGFELGNLAIYLSLCLWAYHRASDQSFIKKFVGIVALSTFFHTGYGFLQYLGLDVVKFAIKRTPISTIGNLNFVAQYLIGTFPLVLGLSFIERGKARAFYILVTIMIILHLLLTHSRGGYVGLFGSLLFFLFLFVYLYGIKRLTEFVRKERQRVAVLFSGLLIVLCTFLVLDYGEAARQVGSIFFPGRGTNIYRLLTWRDTWRMTLEYPLVGVGIGNFQYVFPRYQSPELWEKGDIWGRMRKQRTHNDYLNILAETGFLGVAAFLALILLLLIKGVKALWHCRKAPLAQAPLLIMLMCSIAATLIQSLFDFNLYNPASAMIFWIVLGLAVRQSEHIYNVGQRFMSEPDKSGFDGESISEMGQDDVPLQAQPVKIGWFFLACFLSCGLLIFTLLYVNQFNFGRYISSYYDKQAARHFNKGRYEQASKLARRATMIAPYNADGYQLLADALRHLQRYRPAAEAYRQWRIVEPNFLTIYNRLAYCYIYLGENQLAEQEYHEALRINPNGIAVLVNLANLYFLQGRWAEALSYYERLKSLGHAFDQRDKFNYAEILFRMARFDQALKLFHEIYEARPDNLKVLERIGDCWQALNDIENAEKSYRRCLIFAKDKTAQRLKQKLASLRRTGLSPETP